MTENEIKHLIDKLGFKTTRPEHKWNFLKLHDKKTGKTIYCYNEIMYEFYRFSGYESLEELLDYIHEFQVSPCKRFKNLCLGCKSFEEAYMKIDLLM